MVAAQCKSEDEVIEYGRDAVGVLTQYARVGARAISAMTRCKVIARYGTGVDIVDVDAATRHGVQVTNAPNDWCAAEVADHAVALWLCAARKICEYDRATKAGTWTWQSGAPIWRIAGRVFGLLSFGAIARSIAERVRPFGVQIWAHDPFLDPAEITKRSVKPPSCAPAIASASISANRAYRDDHGFTARTPWIDRRHRDRGARFAERLAGLVVPAAHRFGRLLRVAARRRHPRLLGDPACGDSGWSTT